MNARTVKKALVGRKIIDVKLNRFSNGQGGFANDPQLFLDDGTVIAFSTQETESGDYGTALVIVPPKESP